MKVKLMTPHGVFEFPNQDFSVTLDTFCRQHQLPFNAVSFYKKKKDNFLPVIGKHQSLKSAMGESNELIVRPDRNIDYRSILLKKEFTNVVEHASTEYTFVDATKPECKQHLQLNVDQCRAFVANKVQDFLRTKVEINSSQKIVMGISGGGDSNTLIRSFIESGLCKPNQIHAVMMLGIPDWDKGKDRAQKICDEYDVTLEFVDENRVNKLLGRSCQSDWVTDFEKHYPESDLEVLGTLGIRLALNDVATRVKAQAIVVGINLEDILAESLFQTLKGQMPLPFPVRTIGDLTIWYPLYQCPKKILDGCYPKFALQNYMDRYESKMPGRAIAYYLAQSLNDSMPGVEFDFVRGFEKISSQNRGFVSQNARLGLPTLGHLSLPGERRWQDFVRGCKSGT